MGSRTTFPKRGIAGALVAILVGVAVPLVVDPPPAAPTTVMNETQLRAAFLDVNETSITLTQSIDLVDCVTGALTRTSSNGLTIVGGGFTLHQTCAGKDLMDVSGGGSLTLDHVTLQDDGANGVTNTASVTLTDSTLRGPGGDGISVTGAGATATVIRSLITDTANDGIAANAGATVSLVSSTVDQANNDGVFAIGGGSVTVQNSTITASIGDGIATVGGGGVTLVYATIVENNAGNVFHTGTLGSFGSVVALAGSGVNCSGGANSSQGYNFSDDGSCGFTSTGDRSNAGNPAEGALTGNGGPTPTRAPDPGSPLLDAIPLGACASGITVDQRGFPRPSGRGCDVGAVEIQVPAPPPVPVTPKFTG